MEDMATGDAPEVWNQIGFIISSKYRLAVFQQVVDNPSPPSVIASRADLPVTHISRALRVLAERSLVELRVAAETTKGRVYGITDYGKRLWQRAKTAGVVEG